MIAFDPVNKVVMTFVVGKRNQKEIDLLIRTVRERTDSSIPHFTSDELDLYEKAILKVYGTRKGIRQIEVSPGRKAPKRLPLPDLIYTRVVKTRVNRRIVGVSTEVVFGEKDDAMKAIANSPVSSHINMAFIERNNLTIRERKSKVNPKDTWFLQKEEVPCLFIKYLFRNISFRQDAQRFENSSRPKGKKMDAEDTHDGSRNHRSCMDSFGVDQFQSVMERYLIILGHKGKF